jgi:hypothetical protein
MPGRQSGVSRTLVAVLVVVVVLVIGAGGAAVAKVGPFAGSTASTSPSPAGLAKPADARQAVVDATGRTARFTDVKYTLSTTFTNGADKSTSQAEIFSTTNPPMSVSRLTTSAGKKNVTVTNQAAGVFCTNPEGGPPQRFPNQKIAADAFDPFSGVVASGSNWKYLDDMNVGGHKAWQVVGDIQVPTGGDPAGVHYDVRTYTLLVDSTSGKIEQRVDHYAGTSNGTMFDQVLTYHDFVYDAGGVTIPPCT